MHAMMNAAHTNAAAAEGSSCANMLIVTDAVLASVFSVLVSLRLLALRVLPLITLVSLISLLAILLPLLLQNRTTCLKDAA